MDITFASRGDVRAEVERAPTPSDVWWRARIAGGTRWRVPKLLPWSYGPSEHMAIDAALALWMSAGRPGLRDASAETSDPVRTPGPRLAIAAPDSEANATIVTANPDATVESHQVRETVQEAVHVLASALDRGASTLALTDDGGFTQPLAIGSIIEVRSPEPPEEDGRWDATAV